MLYRLKLENPTTYREQETLGERVRESIFLSLRLGVDWGRELLLLVPLAVGLGGDGGSHLVGLALVLADKLGFGKNHIVIFLLLFLALLLLVGLLILEDGVLQLVHRPLALLDLVLQGLILL